MHLRERSPVLWLLILNVGTVLTDEGQQLVDLVRLDLVLSLRFLVQLSPFDSGLPRAALLPSLLENLSQVPIEEAIARDLAAALIVPRLGELEVTLAQLLEVGRLEVQTFLKWLLQLRIRLVRHSGVLLGGLILFDCIRSR